MDSVASAAAAAAAAAAAKAVALEEGETENASDYSTSAELVLVEHWLSQTVCSP
jgi:hypothetical protein